jgi:type IV secretory pathway VirB2 component (pilin)
MTKLKTNFLMLALAVLTILVPQASFALGSVGDTVCKVYTCIVSSNMLTIIATVGIFFLGIGAFFGKVNWGLVIIIALGIVVIVGAMGIASTLVGGTNSCSTSGSITC